MPSSRFRVDSSGLDGWIRGLENLSRYRPGDAALVRWRQATDYFFDRTQRHVHVITGALKESGQMDVDVVRGNLVGTVTYGGTPECDYAIYEFARGGSHDALTLGYVEAHEKFEQSLALIMEEEVRGWL
jgi:hypothetical protein